MKIGFIIADKDELISIDFSSLDINPVHTVYHGMPCVRCEKNNTEIIIVLCGIGLTCAASAAAYLSNDGVDAVINAGLSGSISGLFVNDIFICEKVAEHDVDLTPIGFEPGKRPELPVFFESDKSLVAFFKKQLPMAKFGVSASGNAFISSTTEKNRILEQFGAKCCDMEYSAIALVCNRENIPCVSIRKISDSADDVAHLDYKSYDSLETTGLFDLVFKSLFNLNQEIFS